MAQELALQVNPENAPESARQALPDIVKRYAAGEPIPYLASELGVHRATLYRWMLAGTGDKQYGELVTHCLVQRVAEADEMLRSASNVCDIARAREIARYARMDLERRRPALYGAKQDQSNAPIQVVVQVFGDKEEKTVVGEQDRTQR